MNTIQTNHEKIEALKAELRHQHMKTLENLLGDPKEALKFLSAMTYSVNAVPELLECDKDSVIQAFMKCAELRLYPSSVSGEAYVLPYKTKWGGKRAQFQLGYQGIITLIYRAGVSSVTSNIVYENDVFDYEEWLESRLVHKPNILSSKKERGKAIGVYAVAVVNGQKLFHVMNAEQIETYKGFSKSGDSEFSPWNKVGWDPELWMWKKTCIKQLAKLLPKNETIFEAIGQDNQDSDLNKPHIERAKAWLLSDFGKLPSPETVKPDSDQPQ